MAMFRGPGSSRGVRAGIPGRRPDQAYNPPAQPQPVNSSAGTLRARLVIVFGGAGKGIFVYSPKPGPGNLIASITASAGTDQWGNAYLAGVNTYSGLFFAGMTAAAISIGFTSNPGQAGAVFGVGNALAVQSPTFGGGDTQAFIETVPQSQNSHGSACVVAGAGAPTGGGDPFSADQFQVIGSIGATLSVFLANRASDPATPTGGGRLYVKAGALYFRGSSGTITNIAPA